MGMMARAPQQLGKPRVLIAAGPDVASPVSGRVRARVRTEAAPYI